ncbi:hypothetical protein TrRE_jg641 [Triparma retinervis]|uniref:Uncharacterized protein n=1 Tax=Triparma retinervis TaxID=2557542 RepID=A0A9W7AEN2_9STRA|nr:hypothetical protein TrRE_jg641 [Triparma retinervis]
MSKNGQNIYRFNLKVIRQESAIVKSLGLEGYLRTRGGYRTQPGSELRTVAEMRRNGLWKYARNIVPREENLERFVTRGWAPPWIHEMEDGELEDLSVSDEVEASMSKLSGDKRTAFLKQLADEVDKGYSLIVTLDAAKSLGNLAFSPYLIREQIKEDGETKFRPLRDMSRAWSVWRGKKVSVNDLVDMNSLRKRTPVNCALALPGILLAIVWMSQQHPGEPLSLRKVDVGACFFRFHTLLRHVPMFSSLLTSSKEDSLVLLCLRLVQGGRASPSHAPILTEAACALYSDTREWDEEEVESVPHPDWVLQEDDGRPQEGFPFPLNWGKEGSARDHDAKAYVDDMLEAHLAKEYRSSGLGLLSCLFKAYRPCEEGEDSAFRPSPAAEKKRDDFVSRPVCTFLGLVVDARALTITVSRLRAHAVIDLLDKVFGDGRTWVNVDELASITGKLTHISQCRTGGRAEMSAIWRMLSCCPVEKRGASYFIQPLPSMIERVSEWKEFLATPTPMPLCYVPCIAEALVATHTGYTDASKLGMGGFFREGRVLYLWRVKFPDVIGESMMRERGDGGTITINELELLGIACQLRLLYRVLCENDRAGKGLVLHTFSDNVTAVADVNKLGVRSPAGLNIIRNVYQHAVKGEYVPTSCFVRGVENSVADTCSRKTGEELLDSELRDTATALLTGPGRTEKIDPASWDEVVVMQVPLDIEEEMLRLALEAARTAPWPTPDPSDCYYGHINNETGIVHRGRLVHRRGKGVDLRED